MEFSDFCCIMMSFQLYCLFSHGHTAEISSKASIIHHGRPFGEFVPQYQPARTSILSITATAKISNARRTTTSRASILAVRTADPPPSDASHAPRARRPRVLERALSGRSKTCAARFSSSGAWGGFSPFPLAPARGARGPRSRRARPPPRVISSRVRQPRARTRSENDGLARGEARPGRERFEA